MSLDRFINTVRTEVAKRFDLKTDAEIDAFFIGLEESAKDNQETLEKRDKMLRDTVAELCEAKRLLKLAVEDFETIESNLEYDEHCVIKTHSIRCDECPLSAATIYRCKWRYADEALALIGEDTNVPASADDTNVGHKSGDWISVNDRLPEAVEEDVNGKIAFSKSVLVYLVYDNGFTYITNDRFRVDSKSWLHEIPGEGCKVTHWMPLPEPPKDGDTNG